MMTVMNFMSIWDGVTNTFWDRTTDWTATDLSAHKTTITCVSGGSDNCQLSNLSRANNKYIQDAFHLWRRLLPRHSPSALNQHDWWTVQIAIVQIIICSGEDRMLVMGQNGFGIHFKSHRCFPVQHLNFTMFLNAAYCHGVSSLSDWLITLWCHRLAVLLLLLCSKTWWWTGRTPDQPTQTHIYKHKY